MRQDPLRSPRFSLELDRRRFVALSALAAGAACFPRLAAGEEAIGKVQPLSVGYVIGSEDLVDLKRLPRALRRPGLEADAGSSLEIVPATSLVVGDGDLYGRPLRIQVRGLYPPAAIAPKQRPALPLAVDLDVVFPSYDPIERAANRFFAWSFRRQGGWDPSPPIRFAFEHDATSPLKFGLAVRDAAGAATRFATTFTIDADPGQPRLRRGLYLLGLASGTWQSGASLATLATPRTALRYASVLVAVEAGAAD